MPNSLAVVTTRAVADHVVNESGYLTFTMAVPSASVFTSGIHTIVERKSLRTCTAGSCAAIASTGAGVGDAGCSVPDGSISKFATRRPLTGSALVPLLVTTL